MYRKHIYRRGSTHQKVGSCWRTPLSVRTSVSASVWEDTAEVMGHKVVKTTSGGSFQLPDSAVKKLVLPEVPKAEGPEGCFSSELLAGAVNTSKQLWRSSFDPHFCRVSPIWSGSACSGPVLPQHPTASPPQEKWTSERLQVWITLLELLGKSHTHTNESRPGTKVQTSPDQSSLLQFLWSSSLCTVEKGGPSNWEAPALSHPAGSCITLSPVQVIQSR